MKTTLIETKNNILSATMELSVIGQFPDPVVLIREYDWDSTDDTIQIHNKEEALAFIQTGLNIIDYPLDLPWNQITKLEVVIGSGFSDIWKDSQCFYKQAQIGYAILHQAKFRNVPAELAFTFKNIAKAQKDFEEFIWAVIADLSIPNRYWAITQQRDILRHALVYGEAADIYCHTLFKKYDAYFIEDEKPGTTFSSITGGNAVRWAKTFRNASHVVAIGLIEDTQDADLVVQMNNNMEKK